MIANNVESECTNVCAKWKVYRVLAEGIGWRELPKNILQNEGDTKNRQGSANGKMGKVPPEKLEPDARGASGHNDGYVKDNDTIHVQTTQVVGEAI